MGSDSGRSQGATAEKANAVPERCPSILFSVVTVEFALGPFDHFAARSNRPPKPRELRPPTRALVGEAAHRPLAPRAAKHSTMPSPNSFNRVANLSADSCRQTTLSTEAKSPREDFRRVKNSLQARNLIDERDGLVWRAMS